MQHFLSCHPISHLLRKAFIKGHTPLYSFFFGNLQIYASSIQLPWYPFSTVVYGYTPMMSPSKLWSRQKQSWNQIEGRLSARGIFRQLNGLIEAKYEAETSQQTIWSVYFKSNYTQLLVGWPERIDNAAKLDESGEWKTLPGPKTCQLGHATPANSRVMSIYLTRVLKESTVPNKDSTIQ